jgi:hypothetical protein
MGNEERKVYHDNKDNLANYIKDTSESALKAFSEAEDVV